MLLSICRLATAIFVTGLDPVGKSPTNCRLLQPSIASAMTLIPPLNLLTSSSLQLYSTTRTSPTVCDLSARSLLAHSLATSTACLLATASLLSHRLLKRPLLKLPSMARFKTVFSSLARSKFTRRTLMRSRCVSLTSQPALHRCSPPVYTTRKCHRLLLRCLPFSASAP